MFGRIKGTVRHWKRDLGNTLTYVRLTLEGNKVERLTDFETCEHPVLMLYGFGATRRTFAIIEERLRRDGFSVFSLNLGGFLDTFNTRCIEELAEHVDEKVERLCKRYKFKKISIIGHSKGGLIGRYYVKRLGGNKRVHTLLTVGTAHNGNPWALLGIMSPLILLSKSIRQMFPMSPFIRSLKEGPFPKNVRFVSIYSRDDKVCFYKSAMLDIPKNATHMNNVEIKGLSHTDLVMRKAAYNAIRRELIAGDRAATQKMVRAKNKRARRRTVTNQGARVLTLSRRS